MGKKGGDLTKTERVTALHDHLMAGGCVTASWYESKFMMSTKTMLRDIRTLKDRGVALEGCQGEDGAQRYSVAISARKIMVPHTIDEVTALFLGRSMFDFLEGTGLQKAFDGVYNGIAKMVKGRDDIDNATKLNKKLYLVHEGPKLFSDEVTKGLDKILMALRREQAIEVSYRNFSGVTHELMVEPYTLVAFKRGLYLVAKVPEWKNEFFRFALERFDDVRLTGESFKYDSTYSPETFFKTALFLVTGKPQKVVLEFPESSKSIINVRRFHPSQKVIHKRNGTIRLELEVPITYELSNWILSFGSNVKVVKPAKLRDEVVNELKKALRQY